MLRKWIFYFWLGITIKPFWASTERTTTALLCHRKFNNSPLFKTHVTIPRHFDKHCACARKHFFRGAAAPWRMFQTNHKQLQNFPIDFDWNIVSFAHSLGQPSYMPDRNLGSELVASRWMLVGGFRCSLCSVLLPVCLTYWLAGRVTLKASRTSCSTLNMFSNKMNM